MDYIFLKIDGINGESKITGHTNEIEVVSFSHGVSQPIQWKQSNTGRTVGRADHQDFTITKHIDLATPTLNEACCQGKQLGTITVTLTRVDGAQVLDYMKYTLEKPLISSISISGGGDLPVETVTFNYSKITWTYNSQKAETGKEGQNEKIWNLETNANS